MYKYIPRHTHTPIQKYTYIDLHTREGRRETQKSRRIPVFHLCRNFSLLLLFSFVFVLIFPIFYTFCLFFTISCRFSHFILHLSYFLNDFLRFCFSSFPLLSFHFSLSSFSFLSFLWFSPFPLLLFHFSPSSPPSGFSLFSLLSPFHISKYSLSSYPSFFYFSIHLPPCPFPLSLPFFISSLPLSSTSYPSFFCLPFPSLYPFVSLFPHPL